MVPAISVPALIGIKGQKHRDTETRTHTSINISHISDVSANVKIRGNFPECLLAKQIIQLAVSHYLASVGHIGGKNAEKPSYKHAGQDVMTVMSELLKM